MQPPRILLVLLAVGCILGALIWLRSKNDERAMRPARAAHQLLPEAAPDALQGAPPAEHAPTSTP